jgi:hypothetical protein
MVLRLLKPSVKRGVIYNVLIGTVPGIIVYVGGFFVAPSCLILNVTENES